MDGRAESAPAVKYAELPAGSSTLKYISLDDNLIEPGPVGWDGKTFVIGMGGKHERLVYRVKLQGSSGAIIGTTRFTGPQYRKSVFYTFWIQGNTIIVPYSTKQEMYGDDQLGLFDYPNGGKARKVIATYNGNVTAPKH